MNVHCFSFHSPFKYSALRHCSCFSELLFQQVMAESAAEIQDHTDSRHSRLLSLPAEIRNRIYNYALVEGRIEIQSHSEPPPQPALLQVNRQIRSEARQMYYRENNFVWFINDYDCGTFIRWSQSSERRKHANHIWKMGGLCVWENVLQWLEAIYYNRVDGPAWHGEERVGDSAAVVHLMEAVRSMGWDQGLSWMEVKANLQHMRRALAAISQDWA